MESDLVVIFSHNKLLASASGVLSAICELQQVQPAIPSQTDVKVELEKFKQQAIALHIPETTVNTAHYLLCASFDEAYYLAAGGFNSAAPSLLSQLHQDTEGGEQFFSYLDDFLVHPEKNFELLQLTYYCLGLGFKGKYALYANSTEALLLKRQQIFKVLAEHQAEQQVINKKSTANFLASKGKGLTLFKFLIGMLILVGLAYLGFTLRLNYQMSQLQQQVEQGKSVNHGKS